MTPKPDLPRQSEPLPGTFWDRAENVRVGDRVLHKRWYEVTHSQAASAGTWMLRFPYGVSYHHHTEPVAIRDRLDPDREHDCDEDGEIPCSVCGYVSGMYDGPASDESQASDGGPR